MAKIPESPEQIFDEFAQDYQTTYGEELLSIILYGSGAKGEYVPKKSDINFLIALSENGIEQLDKSLHLVAKWRERSVSVPLFLTKNYIASALDSFPIEFLDMKQAYQLVYGEDVLKDLEIKKDHVRLQIERELRGKLLFLRRSFLSTGHNRDTLYGMLARSVSTIAAIFEALLFLKDEPLPHSKAEQFQKTAKMFELDDSVFIQLLNIKSGQWRGSRVQLQVIAMQYIGQIKKLVEIVDKILL